MLGGAVAGLPTSAAAAASAAAVAVAAHKQFHPNSPPLDLDSWKEAFLQQANNNTNGNPNKNVRTINVLKFRYCEKTTKIWKISILFLIYILRYYLCINYFDQICLILSGCMYIWVRYLQKSDNLQYNTLARWFDGTNDSLINRLMFQALFLFKISYRLRALKTLYFNFCKIIKNTKINWNDFCKEFCKKLWKKNHTWNIRRLVDESFVPANQRPSVLYWRLSDFSWNKLAQTNTVWVRVTSISHRYLWQEMSNVESLWIASLFRRSWSINSFLSR